MFQLVQFGRRASNNLSRQFRASQHPRNHSNEITSEIRATNAIRATSSAIRDIVARGIAVRKSAPENVICRIGWPMHRVRVENTIS